MTVGKQITNKQNAFSLIPPENLDFSRKLLIKSVYYQALAPQICQDSVITVLLNPEAAQKEKRNREGIMRKLFSFFAVLTVLLFMLACGGGGKGKETIETDEDTTDVEISDNDSDGAEISDSDDDSDDIEISDEDSDNPEATENHQFSGAYQVESSVSGVSVAIVECGKTIELASGKTDASGKFSFNADISADKTYCITANGFASCFKGLSDHVANISEITTAAYLVDKTCENIRKSETRVRNYAKLGTGKWLGELDYSRLSGIKTGLKLLSSFLNTTDPKTLSEKIADDVQKTEGYDFEKFFNGFKISSDKKEVVINTANPESNEVSLNIEGGSDVVAEGFKIVWTALNKTAEAATHKIKSTEPGEYTVRSKLVDDGGDPIMISEDSSTILFLLEKISGTIDVSDMSKHISHYIDNGIYAVIPKNTVITKDGNKVNTLTYTIMMTGDGSQISRIDFGPEGTTFTGDALYFVYELGTVFGGDPIMLSATRSNSDDTSDVMQSAGGDPIMLEAGGDPIMFSAGGDPIMQIARSAGGDPIMQSAGGDPIMNAAGGDPIMNAAGGDPIMTSAAGDPIMSTAAGDPIMLGTSSSVMVAKTNHFSGFQLNSTSLPVSAADLISKWCGDYYYQNYSPVEFIRRGIEKFKPAGDDKTDLLNYFQCPASGETPLYELESDLYELFNKPLGYQRNINLIENLYYVSEFYNRMLAKKENGDAVAAVKNGLELRSAIATLFTSTDAFNRSSTLTGLFDSSDIPLTYSGVTPADYSADALSALTGLSELNDKYAATKKEVMIFANYVMTSSKGPDFSSVSSALTPDQFVCAWFNGTAAGCNKVYTLNENGRVALNGTAVSLADAEQIFAKFFMPMNSRLSDEEKLNLFRTYYLVLRYVGTIFGNSSKIQELNDRLLETAYLVFDGINKNKNAVSIVDTFDASAHTVSVLADGIMETRPYLNKLSNLTDKISLNAATPANVEKVLIKIEGYAHEKASENGAVYYKPTGSLKEKSIILTPGALTAGLKPLKELLGSDNVDELGDITGKMTVVVNSKISGKPYSTQKTYDFLIYKESAGVDSKPVPSNISVFLADSDGNQLPVDSNPGIILNPGNKVLYPNESGLIYIQNLAPATYTLNAFADGYYTKTSSVNVPENSNFGIEIRLDKEISSSAEATLKIKVSIETQKHPNTVYIQIYDEDMVLTANESTVFGESGYADIDISIAAGRYTLLAVGEEMYNYIEDLTVYEGKNNLKEITVVAKNACGNGIVDSAEECEPSVSGSTLEVRCGDIYPAATNPDKTATCNKTTCTFDKSQCGKASVCGDGVIDNGEGCDGGSKACSEISGFGSSNGMAPCAANCSDWITKDNCSRKTASCGTLPENALWNDGLGKFAQTYNGSKWIPETPEPAARYGLTRDECVFSCKKGYKWNENTSECLPDPLSLANICTGETKCFNNTSATAECPAYGTPLFGQDAQYAKLGYCTPHSLEISGDIVVDSFTHYEWQKSASTSAMNWADADAYCAGLNDENTGSSAIWRIPAPQELLTIIDSGRINPALDTNFFTAQSAFWSTGDAKNSGNAWSVTADGALDSVEVSKTNYVLCVRINEHDTVSERFDDTADETVKDTESGLMWLKNYTSSKTWQEALSHCENSIAGGHTDWRLPNRNELASLVDYTVNSGVMSSFPGIATKEFWTSTSSLSEPAKAWPVDFDSGRIIADSKSETHYVLCVRNDSACFGDDCADPCRFDPCRNTVNSTGVCTAEEDGNGYSCVCYSGYEWKAELSKCVLHDEITKGCDIDKLPENAVWNTVGTITQYPDGHGNWYPSTVPEYNETPSTSECRFKCRDHYTWDYDLLKCMLDKKIAQCTGTLPGHAVWTVSQIVQEWSPSDSAWMPRTTDLDYGENENENKCTFHCKEHYSYKNNSCEADTQYKNCTGKPSNAEWNPPSGGAITQTWTDNNGWQPPLTATYNTEPNSNECRFKCADDSFWNSSSSQCINPCWKDPCSKVSNTNGLCRPFAWDIYYCECNDNYFWNGSAYKTPFPLGNICTGQKKCYNNAQEITCPSSSSAGWYGQDPQYTSKCKARSFVTKSYSNQSVVIDNNSGLMWQQEMSDYTTWGYAKSYCDNLTYAGFDDWRLPTSLELFTIHNIGSDSVETNFQASSRLWSSDKDVTNDTKAWRFNGSSLSSLDYNNNAGVLCVRGTTMPSSTLTSSTNNGDVIVTDNKTGLIWQKTISSNSFAYVNALAYCQNLEYAGYSDWRLPNRNELASLVNYKKSNPASNFPNMPSEEFWTSSAEYESIPFGFYVDFSNGKIDTRSLTGTSSNQLRVRCVRGGSN